MDEPDADQILTIDELRSLRDRMGAEAAAPVPVTSAAGFEIPDPTAGVPMQAQPDPWEDLRRRATDQRRWAGFRWGKPLAIAGCLAVAGGGVAALLLTGHTRADPPASVKVSTPVSPAPAVTSALVSVVLTPEPSIVPPEPTVPASTAPAPTASEPLVPAPSPPADDTTTEPPTAAVPPPRATYRPKPPTAAKPPAARPAPAGVPEPARPPGAAPEQAGNASAAPEPQPTLSRTPTSWSPAAPG